MNRKKNCYIFVKLPILLNYIYFLNTETTFKKITEDDKRKLAELEHRVYKALEHSLQCFNNHFVPLKNKLSPKISTLQPFMDIYPERKYADKLLEKNGFINSHLCLNAQTASQHTEPDSSYTIITVPKQSKRTSKFGFENVGNFELIINDGKTIVIPMKIGTIFTYSAYMLTHRQQIAQENSDNEPLINIVSYNSKRLFSNMIESFRRDIFEDKKSIGKRSIAEK